MGKSLTGIVVTGASGFIGRNFVIDGVKKYRLFCIARRSQKESGIPHNENIHWLHADISKWKNLKNVLKYISDHGGADYVLHLAGYYDFTLKENPAYKHTNVTGTQNIIDLSKKLEIKRFIFSSSLAACKFPPKGKLLTETSPVDADFPYAQSKKRGEEIIKHAAQYLPCSIVRLAAVYSDWCEYPFLYLPLKAWLSGNYLTSRIVAGKGESAVPYIHIKDLNRLFMRIIEISDNLPDFGIYIGSPSGSVSHNQLFQTATRYYHSHNIRSVRIPKRITKLGLIIMAAFERLIGREPLEQPWMAEYIDKKLSVDASYTYDALGWQPAARYHILRRLLFLTEKMINHPNNWRYRNEIFLKRVPYRKSLKIYDLLSEARKSLVNKIIEVVMAPENKVRFPNYRKMDQDLLKWYITLNYQLVSASVRNRDRSMIPNYAQVIAYHRFVDGFGIKEVKDMMFLTGQTMEDYLLKRPELKDARHRVDDYIILTSQLGADEFEDTYEILKSFPPGHIKSIENLTVLAASEDIKRIVHNLEDICSDSLSYQLSSIWDKGVKT